MKPQKNIIIKKVKKAGHEGGHGGSWKVAYADFVTAMMAFFLLLWLITMVAPEKRARVSAYFKSFSIFEKSGSSMMFDSPGGVVGEAGGKFGKMEKELGRGVTDLMSSPERFKEQVKGDIEAKLSDVKDQILVDVFEGGVKIQLTDKEGRTMFPLGGADLTPQAKNILKVITENFKNVDNKIAIEGHTDALSYSSNRYTNWELSTERASAARKELELNGLNPDRLVRVAGYAATDPLIKEDPNDPRNRRISIILLYPGHKKPVEGIGPEVLNTPKDPPIVGGR
jgi:chemotaxis protein MotB